MVVTGIVDRTDSYSKIPFAKNNLNNEFKPTKDVRLIILDLPISLNGKNTPELYAYLQGTSNMPLYAKLSNDISTNWNRICNILPSSSIGTVREFYQVVMPTIFHIDEGSHVFVNSDNLDISNSGSWSYGLVGEELIAFKYIEKIQTGLYKISYLTRGLMGTERYMMQHVPLENFVLLNSEGNTIPLSEKLQDHSIDFKCGDCEISIIYKNKAQVPLSPYMLKQEIIGKNLYLSWIYRTRNDGNWQFAPVSKPHEFIITITAAGNEISSSTALCEIIIDIRTLDISAGYKVAIVVHHKQ